MSALRRFLLRHKARLARLTAVAGLLSVGLLLMREVPRNYIGTNPASARNPSPTSLITADESNRVVLCAH